MKFLILSAASVMAGYSAMADEADMPVVTQIGKFSTTMTGQPIVLPSGNVEVVTSLYLIPPGKELPVHRHPFPRYGYVLSGELSVTNEVTKKAHVFSSGEFVIESVQQWHRGRSSGSSPLKLLVIDQAPSGTVNTEIQAPSK